MNGKIPVRKKVKKFLFYRIIYVAIAVSLQVVWVVLQFMRLADLSTFVNTLIKIISVVTVLWVMNREMNPSYRILWSCLILAFPVFGLVIFLLVGESRMTSLVDRSYTRTIAKGVPGVEQDIGILLRLEQEYPLSRRQVKYIAQATGDLVYENTRAEYYATGEDMFESLLGELKNAKHYIFMEYFIINDGVMWKTILDILEEKASQGVDVRLIYDDFGCMTTLPINYYDKLRSRGIQSQVFNPFRFIANIVHNNRDHRKLCIIDGHTGFTGGINLADEYINVKNRFGKWKDTGVMLKGDAVFSMTVMFLQMWTVVTNSTADIVYDDYRVNRFLPEPIQGEGFFQVFGDSPLDNEPVGQNVYLNILSRAQRYVYICTPYLIIDDEMSNALCMAARSGVDVRIMTPGIPDKKLVFLLTKSYYGRLVKAGVRVFSYQPGFLHAKSFVCDGKVAVLGTINLDYRSLYLHFENGVCIYGAPAVGAVYEDFLETLDECREVTLEECMKTRLPVRILQNILRILGPLL